MATRISHSGPITLYQAALEPLSVALMWCRRITSLTTTAIRAHEALDCAWDCVVSERRGLEAFAPDPVSREMPFLCEAWPHYH